jgi:threonine dehydrogenase-like Zn-dependent dehydrogenase
LLRRQLGPAQAGSWVVVEPLLTGLCSSDLKEARGVREARSDFGHEVVGVVAAGTVEGLPTGTRVCLDPHVEVERTTAFAEAMLVRGEPGRIRAALPRAPRGASEERAVFVEPLACVARCAERVEAGASVAILGAGTSAVLLSVLLRLKGCRPALVNRSPGRLDLLRGRTLAEGLRLLLAEEARETFGTVVVTTARMDLATFQLAWRLLPGAGGRLVLFGGIPGDWRAPGSGLQLDALRRREQSVELAHEGKVATVLGSHGPTAADFATAIAVLERPLPWTAAHVEELIAGRLDLSGLVEELGRAVRSGRDPIGKRVVRPWPGALHAPSGPG